MNQTEPICRVIIADDEPLARDLLLEMLGAHPEICVVASCRNGLEAVRAISEHRPDLAFLDIEMPRLDAFEVLELAEHQVAVIFVTAYDAYAVRAFEAQAVDYLLKPYSQERLAAAVSRALRLRESPRSFDPAALRRSTRPEETWLERIAIKDGAEITIVDVSDVSYIRAEDDYVRICAAGREHLKHQTMGNLESALDPRRFVRIHRSCIVNALRVTRIEPETKDRFAVALKDGVELPASRAGARRLREILGL